MHLFRRARGHCWSMFISYILSMIPSSGLLVMSGGGNVSRQANRALEKSRTQVPFLTRPLMNSVGNLLIDELWW